MFEHIVDSEKYEFERYELTGSKHLLYIDLGIWGVLNRSTRIYEAVPTLVS